MIGTTKKTVKNTKYEEEIYFRNTKNIQENTKNEKRIKIEKYEKVIIFS